ETALPNVSEIAFYLEQAEVGFGREEMQRIFLGLKHLVDSEGLPRCRLWGKILGIESNYIVAEAEYREGEEEQESIEDQPAEEEKEPENPENEQVEVRQNIHYSTSGTDPTMPVYPSGPNGYSNYFSPLFCIYLLKDRYIKRLNLNLPKLVTIVKALSTFKQGLSKNPSTLNKSPFNVFASNLEHATLPTKEQKVMGIEIIFTGVYEKFNEHSINHIQTSIKATFINNYIFCKICIPQSALSFTLHLTQQLLTNLNECVSTVGAVGCQTSFSGMFDMESTREAQYFHCLLTITCVSSEMFNTSPWSSKVSTILTFQHAIAVLRSNLWPGAFAYACGKKFENIYIGWGLKYVGEVYSPPIPPPPLMEYQNGPEITEGLDPTPEEEQALKEDLEEQQAALEEAEASEDDEDED
uniref:Radial spoke head component 4A n=1 Tax=Poecilia formosa TaxID=48698 RepID=A0A096LWE2_POEFO